MEDIYLQMQSGGLLVWFTGLSGAGKTTLCRAVAQRLQGMHGARVVLDGDDLRRSLHADLGYTRADREEHIRRIGCIAQQCVKDGAIVLVAAIAPYRSMRAALRQKIPHFVEVYVNAPLATCMARDPRGLYRRALAGEIASFTGISDPYESPMTAEVECCTDCESVPESVEKVCAAIMRALTVQRSTEEQANRTAMA